MSVTPSITTKILRIPTNQKFSSNPELLSRLLADAHNVGIRKQSHGMCIENSTHLYWHGYFPQDLHPHEVVNVWPPDYGTYKEQRDFITDGESEAHVFSIESFPEEAFAAPVTEIANFTLRSGVLLEEFKAAMADVRSALQTAEGGHRFGWAFVAESTSHVYTFAGWDAVEKHTEFVETEIGAAVVGKLTSLVENIEVVHVKFNAFHEGHDIIDT